jgi:hypothetical protein
MTIRKHFLVLPSIAAIVFAGCTADLPYEDDGEASSDALTGSCAGTSTGPCAGHPIDDAVHCATALGARVLSYYRTPAQQECVRRQNHCTDRCTGSVGCSVITAGCTSSPHTRCTAVDLVGDGFPVSRAQLRACGLDKLRAAHANHYDYAGGATPSPAPGNPADPTTPSPSSGSCRSATLGRDVPPGTCVQRADNTWYVCDANDLAAWPAIYDATDPQCTSCPQLPGGTCQGSSGDGSGKGGEGGGEGGGGKGGGK